VMRCPWGATTRRAPPLAAFGTKFLLPFPVHQNDLVLFVLSMTWTIQDEFCLPRRQAAVGPRILECSGELNSPCAILRLRLRIYAPHGARRLWRRSEQNSTSLSCPPKR